MCSIFFFFKQKRAYEMRISDWSSDVCSSDLTNVGGGRWPRCPKRCRRRTATQSRRRARAADARLQPPMKVSNSSFTFSTTMTDAITQASDASHGAITKRPIFSRSVTKRTSGITANGSCIDRSEEHTAELQSLMRQSYAVFCLKKKK